MKSDKDIIPLLICKRIVGTLTPEEQDTLDAWRKESEHNEAAYQRLMDNERQTVELNRRRLTDYEHPLDAMKQRLGFGTKKHRALYYLVAATIAFLLIGGAALLWNRHQMANIEQSPVLAEIQPGHTQATLTRSNGETVDLLAEADMGKLKLHHDNNPTAKHEGATAVPINSLTTPRGGEFKVTLEDGTEVWLNADTRLSYPETFEGNERRVELEGEAYFKVAKNEAKPFYVVSGGQEVRVYGTEFNINAYADQPLIYTTLVEGSISLRPVEAGKRELMMTPGNQAVFSQENASAKVHQVDTDVVTSWRSGTFVFEDQTLEQIMRTLSRWYDFDYEFRDAKTAQMEFMGSIPKYGTFAEVCDIFHKLGGIQLRQSGRKVIISEK